MRNRVPREGHLDHRSRANALEAVWGVASDEAVRIMKEFAGDASNRVAGNALIGLHLAGRPEAIDRTLHMAQSRKVEARLTAVWVMGKIGSPEFVPRLKALAQDDYPQVRSAALRSLIEIRAAESRRRKEAAIAPPPAAQPECSTLVDKSPPPAADSRLFLDGSHFTARR